jgi:hypothetical protein
MPIDLEVIHASEFIRMDPHEHLDLEESKKMLAALALACRKRGIGRALLDLRTVPIPARPQFTPTELAALVRTFREAGFTREQRLAVLYHTDIFGGIRNFAFFGRMRGLQVQAFTDFEEALLWLSDGQETCRERPERGIPVPINPRPKQVGKVRVRRL